MIHHLGVKGAVATTGSGIASLALEAIPILQALALLTTCLVGVATIAWYAYQAYHLKKRKEK